MFDYGDESQREQITIEGAEWLQNRILSQNTRIIVARENLSKAENEDRDYKLGMHLLVSLIPTWKNDQYRRVFNVR